MGYPLMKCVIQHVWGCSANTGGEVFKEQLLHKPQNLEILRNLLSEIHCCCYCCCSYSTPQLSTGPVLEEKCWWFRAVALTVPGPGLGSSKALSQVWVSAVEDAKRSQRLDRDKNKIKQNKKPLGFLEMWGGRAEAIAEIRRGWNIRQSPFISYQKLTEWGVLPGSM